MSECMQWREGEGVYFLIDQKTVKFEDGFGQDEK
jgi:hypothetical protein